MKFPTFATDIRSVSFWYRFGIVGLAILSIYFISEKFISRFEYPFLTDPSTIKVFRNSNTIVIIQNDTHLKNKIRKIYGSIAVFCTAKNKSELVAELETFCIEDKNLIVVNEDSLCDDPEKCPEGSLDPLPDLAERFKYCIYITKHRKTLLPIYVAWLLNKSDSEKVRTEGTMILQELLETVPQFSESFKNFSGQASIKDMVKYYQLAASNANGMLHCTAKYMGRAKMPGSREYWEKREVIANLGRGYGLDVIGLVWTPRTFGARVRLSKEELVLWGGEEDGIVSDDEVQEEKPGNFTPVKGRGSRAHITVGVAPGVSAVVTGKDLLEIVRLEAMHKEWPTYACQLGWLRDYGSGQWVLYSHIDTVLASVFSGVYGD